MILRSIVLAILAPSVLNLYVFVLFFQEPKYALAYSSLRGPLGGPAYSPYVNQAYSSSSQPQSRSPSPVLELTPKLYTDDDDNNDLNWVEQLSRPDSGMNSLAVSNCKTCQSDLLSVTPSLHHHVCQPFTYCLRHQAFTIMSANYSLTGCIIKP